MDPSHARAVVTGGASGIGRAVVRRLLRAGARVAVVDLPGSVRDGALAALRDATFVPTDVTDERSVTAALHTARDSLGGINVLVSCAGIATPTPVRDRAGKLRPLSDFRNVVGVNLIGLYDVVRHCVAAMVGNEPGEDGERGVIVNISSIAAFEGQAGQSAYASSKGAVAALTLPLARELAPLGIRVMAICPGFVDTPMLGGMPDRVRDRLFALPLFPRRPCDPTEVADLVLACLAIRYLNGEVIRIDAATRLPDR